MGATQAVYVRVVPDQRGADGGWKRPSGSAGGVHLQFVHRRLRVGGGHRY